MSQCRLSDATIWLTEYGRFVLPGGFPREAGERVWNTGSPVKYGRSGNPMQGWWRQCQYTAVKSHADMGERTPLLRYCQRDERNGRQIRKKSLVVSGMSQHSYPPGHLGSHLLVIQSIYVIVTSSLRITDRSFQYASPRLWNQLSDYLSQPHTKPNLSNSKTRLWVAGLGSVPSTHHSHYTPLPHSFIADIKPFFPFRKPFPR